MQAVVYIYFFLCDCTLKFFMFTLKCTSTPYREGILVCLHMFRLRANKKILEKIIWLVHAHLVRININTLTTTYLQYVVHTIENILHIYYPVINQVNNKILSNQQHNLIVSYKI